MIIKTEQVKLVLYNTALTGYFLEKSGIGISRQAISQLRNKGEENFEKLPLETVMKVQKWIDDGNYRFSYDYENIIANLEDDIEDGNVSDKIYVLRDSFDERIGANPILGYYVSLDDVAEGDTVQEMSVESALREMEKFNEIF